MAANFDPVRSPMWNAFAQACFELGINVDDLEMRNRAWEIWYKGFTCGVVNAGSAKLGKISGDFDPRRPSHELGYWSVIDQRRRISEQHPGPQSA